MQYLRNLRNAQVNAKKVVDLDKQIDLLKAAHNQTVAALKDAHQKELSSLKADHIRSLAKASGCQCSDNDCCLGRCNRPVRYMIRAKMPYFVCGVCFVHLMKKKKVEYKDLYEPKLRSPRRTAYCFEDPKP